MIASRQVDFLLYKGIGRQRRKGLGALAQVIGRTAIPFLSKFLVPTAKRVGVDFLEFVVTENEEVVW